MNTVPPLPEGCPWSTWTRPNIDWCEENLCAWIVNPADTWSNLPLVLFGLWMLYRLRSHPEPLLRWFGPVAIFTGISSGLFHASYTFFFQFFDFFAMFLFAFLPLVMNLRRLGRLEGKRAVRFYLLGVVVFSAMIPLGTLGFPIQLLVAALIFTIVGLEIFIRVKKLPSTGPGLFLLACGLLAISATFSALDLSRVLCDPENHLISGHAVWHVLTATALWVLSLYYARQPRPEPADA